MQDDVSCFDDIGVLFRDGSLFDVGFFCDMDLKSSRFWNRLSRFTIVYLFLIGVLKQDSVLMATGFFSLSVVYVVNCLRRSTTEKMKAIDTSDVHPPVKTTCYAVSEQNPFGNPSVGFKNEIPTCKNQQEAIDKYFFKDLPVSPLDPFRRQSQPRQFYTVPNTTDVNAQTEFAQWLYN